MAAAAAGVGGKGAQVEAQAIATLGLLPRLCELALAQHEPEQLRSRAGAMCLLIASLELPGDAGLEPEERVGLVVELMSDESEALNRKALETSRRVFGESNGQANVLRYNLACALARQGRSSEAVTALREAVDHGFGSLNWHDLGSSILDDPDLASLHGDPEFEAIAEELEQANEENQSAASK